MFLGEPTGPAPQEQAHAAASCSAQRSMYSGLSCGFDSFPLQHVVELVGEAIAGSGIAMSGRRRPVGDGRAEREGTPEAGVSR